MHYSEREWLKYVNDALDPDVREKFENHLYTCDQCLNIYLQAVESSEKHLPAVENEADFTDAIMTQIMESSPSIIKKT